MAIYPADLPAPTVSGYQLSPVDQTIRSDMEVGTARVRRKTSARDDQISLSWTMDDTQLATFRAWFDGTGTDDCQGGAVWFNGMNLAVGGGLTQPDCRFIGPFSSVLLDGTLLWSVSAKVEVR